MQLRLQHCANYKNQPVCRKQSVGVTYLSQSPEETVADLLNEALKYKYIKCKKHPFLSVLLTFNPLSNKPFLFIRGRISDTAPIQNSSSLKAGRSSGALHFVHSLPKLISPKDLNNFIPSCFCNNSFPQRRDNTRLHDMPTESCHLRSFREPPGDQATVGKASVQTKDIFSF